MIGQKAAGAHASVLQCRAGVVKGSTEGRVPWEHISLAHKDFNMAEVPACRALS